MSSFKPGDRVELVVSELEGYNYQNPIGHQATVLEEQRGFLPQFLWVKWDQPSEQVDGGFHLEAFRHVGGPW